MRQDIYDWLNGPMNNCCGGADENQEKLLVYIQTELLNGQRTPRCVHATVIEEINELFEYAITDDELDAMDRRAYGTRRT